MTKKTGKGRDTAQTRHKLRAHLQVEQLEDRNLLSASGPAPALFDAAGVPLAHVAVVPSDTSYGSQYALNNTGQTGGKNDADIDAPEAWSVTTGSLTTVVGIVDTGIDYKHIDLYQNIWINQAEIPGAIKSRLRDLDGDRIFTFRDLNDTRNQGSGKVLDVNKNGRIDGGDLLASTSQGGWADGVDTDKEGHKDDLIGWDFANNDNNPYDDNGHGTHVAGIVGAMGDNGVGVSGVNWHVEMMALKFMGSNGSGSATAAIAAIDYAVAHGAIASNHSWSMGDYYYQPLYDAINRARLKGHIVVAAAGNGGSDSKGDNNDTTPSYPASYGLANVIAVAATTSNDVLTSYSNYGAKSVDLAAPGGGILSTYPGDKYQTLGGTSMAAPFVTGVVALLRSEHPDWSATQIIQQVLGSADKLSVLSGKTVTGGRLNAAKAVGASQGDVTGPRVVSLTPNGSTSVSSLRVTFDEALDLASFSTADVSLSGPGGAITVTRVQAVAGSGNKEFDVSFSAQTTPGTYQVLLGPDVKDARGNKMDQDRDGLGGEATQDRYSSSFAVNSVTTWTTGGIRVTDNSTTRVKLTVDRDITIADLKVKLMLTHAQVSELYIHLRAPDGTDVVLSNRRGGTGANFKDTLFDDDAATALKDGTAPFTGTFRPDGSLSAFQGTNASGVWELVIEDRAAGNNGRLNYITLQVEGLPATASSSVEENQILPNPTGQSFSNSPVAFQDATTSPSLLPAVFLVESVMEGGNQYPSTSGRPCSTSFAQQSVDGGTHAATWSSTTVRSCSADILKAEEEITGLFFEGFSTDQLMSYFESLAD